MERRNIYPRILLLCLSAICYLPFGHGQCSIGSTLLFGQTGVNDFGAYFNDPNCTELLGSLRVVSYAGDPVTSLAPLSPMQGLSGTLTIENCDQLSSLNGLHNLEFIGGSLYLSGNNGFTTLAGLGALDTIGAQMFITDNNLLLNFSGLNNLKFIGQNLIVYNADNLSDFTHLSGLFYLRSLAIQECANISSLAGFENLDPETLLDLTLIDNPLLATCDVQSICNHLSMGGAATIYSNFAGCNSVAEVEDDCSTACLENIIVGQNPVNLDTLFASNTVSTLGNITISGGDTVVFKAGNSVNMNYGFTVHIGSEFHAYIEPCIVMSNLTPPTKTGNGAN